MRVFSVFARENCLQLIDPSLLEEIVTREKPTKAVLIEGDAFFALEEK